MASIQAPTLETNLEEGHSSDCKHLDFKYYGDLYEDIKGTISQTREALLEFMDDDIDSVDALDSSLQYALQWSNNYEQLVYKVSGIQSLVRSSNLSEAQKLAIWTPIAECYQRVQTALNERIIPLDERELLKYGDTVVVPVRIFPCMSRIGANTAFSRFKYALERHTDSGRTFRDSLTDLSFRDDYLRNLSPDVQRKLPREGTIDLPLKIVSVEYGMLTIVEIDEEAFMRM
ncbi:hypothetical protein HON58_02030 [Candidatus Peregrinibacteria bacterium]|jgi:hypothetical protein|nr:hypothetical protein [Candidatus Peregrinibacteria bacterium]